MPINGTEGGYIKCSLVFPRAFMIPEFEPPSMIHPFCFIATPKMTRARNWCNRCLYLLALSHFFVAEKLHDVPISQTVEIFPANFLRKNKNSAVPAMNLFHKNFQQTLQAFHFAIPCFQQWQAHWSRAAVSSQSVTCLRASRPMGPEEMGAINQKS